jgi:protein TonB
MGNVPALPPPPKAAAPARIKQGGQVTAASIITQTRPLYPALARQARIQGNVVLHAIIDKEGKVAQLEVISGHPLLVQSALDAVKQWRYKPTQLNGDPVEVDTTITVTFTMGG